MHREHHTKTERRGPRASTARSVGVAVAVLVAGACATSVPQPKSAQVRVEDYVAVPFPPRTPPVEMVPPRPSGDVVWVDGTWEWDGRRYRWSSGGWVTPPAGARRARWVILRRSDGQLFFAPARWRDAADNPIRAPEPIVMAGGERRRERSRPEPIAIEEDGMDAGLPQGESASETGAPARGGEAHKPDVEE